MSAGIVYVLVNEAFDSYVKIGKTINLKQRLQSRLGLKPNSYLKQTREMYRRMPSHKQYLIAEVLESNDPQNITEEPDTTRDEIIDKTLGEYTAAIATVKL